MLMLEEVDGALIALRAEDIDYVTNDDYRYEGSKTEEGTVYIHCFSNSHHFFG